ncbi:putative guanine nucleotide exchange factor for Rho/Rac/Cdc42-like GTPases [Lyophyllum shimeji]|uniref:Guanine nucleotide exchange factor for Rho/Rac/Cdc42-like GTPases n=1 Tax=Lyophyllum shimeji TaxID=47721 RepID=A0A9P3PEG2_LYOSH|nr:putative guanine nucleotide exchange factor for Rho/Rac/Cdc42-like GTPases [Lyophyllum shimeji]
MALSSSPRKTVPLASGDDYCRPRKDSTGPGTTKRVFYCGVVVEGSENGRRLPEDIQDLVLSLGTPLRTDTSTDVLSTPQDSALDETDRVTRRKRALTDSSALSSVINELVTSERSYVKRLQILKHDYADPLRNFARSKDTAIIPAYEAKTLFGNIDNLLPVNEAFLTDLEKMMAPNGPKTVGGVGDVALRHFKELRSFEQYKQYYVKREEAQLIFEREVSKRSSRFASFIDHIKYQSTDPRSRVGLRELLMEPVQRIPRYTLLFRNMLKHMAPGDPQRAKLIEADEIASKIALAEADEQTKRAAIFYCLTATIDGFPPDLFSNSRRFVDCLDVEDVLNEQSAPAPNTSSGSANSLHCTLFLFDDKLVIVKRPGNGEKGGRMLSGLDELEKVTKAGGIPVGKKKSGMTCKGVVDVTEVVATDVGGADFHLYLESPPQDQTERWSGRPFRALSVVNPPHPVNLDPTQTATDKRRFLENLWHVQATYRARAGQSVVLRADEQEVESKVGKATIARTYYNVYQRTAFLQEPKKTKIVVHIDPLGSADPIPLGMGAAPFASIRIQPLAGQLCRYTVKSNVDDEAEEDIVQTERVPSRIVDTIHQFGFFEFRTGRNSRPSTPTARSRVAIFGLDAISRNLFNTRPGSAMGDFFGGSINGHKRTKSTTSRSSTYTQTTTTGDGSLTKFSSRTGSTAATSIMDDDTSFFSSRSSRSKKLLKRDKSPGGWMSDSDKSPTRRLAESLPFSRSRSPSRERRTDNSELEEDDSSVFAKTKDLDDSDRDLALQLELARRNSKNQHGHEIPPLALEEPVEATIYEDEPPQPVRPLSRASRDSNSTTTPRPESNTPTKALVPPTKPSRSPSPHTDERRPQGPRSPSPLPPTKTPPARPFANLPPADDEDVLEENSFSGPQVSTAVSRQREIPTGIPRSKRQPFFPAGNAETTPKAAAVAPSPAPSVIEPLSIKKKTSVRSNGTVVASPTPVRRPYNRNSPLARNSSRVVSPRRVSPQVGKRKLNGISKDNAQSSTASVEKMVQLSHSTVEDIESSRRTIKRIKLQVDDMRCSENAQGNEGQYSRPSSPDKEPRTPQRQSAAMTKAAQERMEEMRQLIGRRQLEGEGTPRTRPRSVFDTPTRGPPPANISDTLHAIEALVSEADRDLERAVSNQKALQQGLRRISVELEEKSTELERARVELQNAKRQTELVKSLLADATAEKEIMYEAFNEELDGMYNDVNLPDDEAWTAMSNDLKQTKETRNALSKENSQLKRRLTEAEMQRDEWGALLRAHGLIP